MTDRITESGNRLRFTICIGYTPTHGTTSQHLRAIEAKLSKVAGGFTRMDGVGGWIETAPDGDFSGEVKREASTMFVVSVDGAGWQRAREAWTAKIREAVAPHARSLRCTWVHMECQTVEALHFRSDAF